MKILLVSNTYITKMSQEKPQALGKLVDRLVVLTPSKMKDTLRNLTLERLENPSFKLVGLKSIPVQHNAFRVFDPLEIRRIVKEEKPDVVCIEQEPYSISTFQFVRLKKEFGFKVVLLSMQNLFKKYPPPFSWMESYCLNRTDLFLGASSSIVPVWIEKGVPSSKCRVLAQVGVNTQEFRPITGQKEKYGMKGFVFGYAGRFVEEKGIQVLIEAFSRMKNLKECQLMLVGRGPFKGQLESAIQKSGVGDRVRFFDGVKHHDMPSVLNAMDALVLPSLIRPHWKEQFGHIIIEAQSCGVPVIGSDYEPIPEVTGLGGMTFKTESVDSLLACMEKITTDRPAFEDLRKKARTNVETRFTNHVISEKFLEMVNEIL